MHKKLNVKYELSNEFTGYEHFLLNIKEHFSSSHQHIHKARNELKVIDHRGISTVVKAFKIPDKPNQFVYGKIRDSKAKRSYYNSLALNKLGVHTPNPVGYIDFYDSFLFRESFFINEKFNHDFTIREALENKKLKNRDTIIKQFVRFTYYLHKNNVYHKDYSAGNILVIKQNNGEYKFSLVDVNRMAFKSIDDYLGIDNFAKLWLDEEDLQLIATEYSKLANIDGENAISFLKRCDKKLKSFVEFKKMIKCKLRRNSVN